MDPATLKPQPNKDVLLVVGDASGVAEDLVEFIDFGIDFDTMAINYSVLIVPWEIQHFVAGDSHMPDMQKVAREMVGPDVLKHCWNPESVGFDIRWMRSFGGGWDGTTATLAVRIGIALDYTNIVLAGVPMDKSGNWYRGSMPDNDVKKNKDHRPHLWKWTEVAGRPIGRFIRSMSGNTMDLFGKPTTEWLLGKEEHHGEKV